MASVGLIGVGRMGSAMWRRLRDSGVDAAVADASPEATAALAAEGARVCPDPASVAAASDLVLLSLPTSTEVEDVTFGPMGIASGAPAGTLVVDTTSGVPSASRRIAEQLQSSGVRYVDAGVSGGVEGARAGTLKVMVGGSSDDVAAAGPIFEHLAARVWHCGEVGAGHTVKTLLNLANQTKLMVELEAMIAGASAGLDPRVIADVLDLVVWKSWLLGADGRRPFGFPLALVCKDFDIAMRLAAENGVAVPVGGAALQAARIAAGEAGGDADLMDAVAVWERLAGVDLTPEGGTS